VRAAHRFEVHPRPRAAGASPLPPDLHRRGRLSAGRAPRRRAGPGRRGLGGCGRWYSGIMPHRPVKRLGGARRGDLPHRRYPPRLRSRPRRLGHAGAIVGSYDGYMGPPALGAAAAAALRTGITPRCRRAGSRR
jgi:hypothetical protein